MAATDRTIQVEGYGEIMVEPDSARIEMAVAIVGTDLVQAKKEVDKALSEILEVAKKLEIAPQDLTATELQISAQYDYQKSNNDFVTYETTRGVTITLRKITKLDQLLTGCLQAGANRIDRIQLESTNDKKLKNKALNLAIDDAKQMAKTVATGFGAKVGNVQTIAGVRGPLTASFSAPIEGLSDGDSYKPGKIRVSAEIGVVFQLD
jgi:uncharacterized protein YggE